MLALFQTAKPNVTVVLSPLCAYVHYILLNLAESKIKKLIIYIAKHSGYAEQ